MKRAQIWWVAGGVLVVASAVVVAVLGTRTTHPMTTEVRLGRVADLPPGAVRTHTVRARFFDPGLTVKEPNGALEAHGWKSSVQIHVVHDAQTGFLAFLSRDPHLGCRVVLVSDLHASVVVWLPAGAFFMDPCHGESFDGQGRCFEWTGCTRGLDRFGLRVALDGSVVVNLRDLRFGSRALRPGQRASRK